MGVLEASTPNAIQGLSPLKQPRFIILGFSYSVSEKNPNLAFTASKVTLGFTLLYVLVNRFIVTQISIKKRCNHEELSIVDVGHQVKPH